MCILSSLCRRNCGTPLPFRRRRRDACDGLTFRLLTTSCRSSCCVSRFLAASKPLAACTNCCLHKYDRSPSRATRATGVLFVRCGETLVRLVRPAPARVVVALPCTSNKQQAPQASPFCLCVVSKRQALLDCGVGIDGGKDSLSMAARCGDELVKSPGTLVMTVRCVRRVASWRYDRWMACRSRRVKMPATV